jgi:hypothetical protein
MPSRVEARRDSLHRAFSRGSIGGEILTRVDFREGRACVIRTSQVSLDCPTAISRPFKSYRSNSRLTERHFLLAFGFPGRASRNSCRHAAATVTGPGPALRQAASRHRHRRKDDPVARSIRMAGDRQLALPLKVVRDRKARRLEQAGVLASDDAGRLRGDDPAAVLRRGKVR